ncbi:MFS transporter [Exiguobacterium aurantiacum]|uniref:Major facilitator superfamily transporter n=1 Tax=Exiguobacterium aurantiacum TaxID=33987 RepID=A0A377FWB0_9BACL|nr:MFS transporter [Exiguobacterium aurantiacum]STO09058.1 major facilitator superfamily transporter [Exiguobacterium aurantiacum]
MNKTSAFVIYSIVFFAFFDLFAQLPVMSTFATSVGATPFLAGVAIAIYSLSNTFGNILSGVWTDRTGPFRILLAGLVLSSVSLFMYHVVDTPTTLLVVRIVHGFVAGLIVPAAFTLSANLTAANRQGKKVALTGSFVGLAAILGPAFSGIMASRTSVPVVFSFVAFYGLAVALLALVVLRQLRLTGKRIDTDEQPVSDALQRDVLKAYVGAFLLMFSQGALAYLLPLYVQALGYDSRLSGTLLSTFGIVAVLVFVLPTNRLFDRVEPTKLAALGITILGVSQLLIGTSGSAGALYAVLALYGVGFAILFPAINTLLIKATNRANRGKSYGYFYAFFSLGTVVGSALLGWLTIPLTNKFTVTGIVLLGSGVAFFALEQMRKRLLSPKSE